MIYAKPRHPTRIQLSANFTDNSTAWKEIESKSVFYIPTKKKHKGEKNQSYLVLDQSVNQSNNESRQVLRKVLLFKIAIYIFVSFSPRCFFFQ